MYRHWSARPPTVYNRRPVSHTGGVYSIHSHAHLPESHPMRASTIVLVTLAAVFTSSIVGADDWISLFDGKTYDGWKANENTGSWKIEDGAFIANGPRSHLFYVGDKKPFVNFEFKAEVMTRPGSNGGIYFHTEFQEGGWPSKGYECQVNISQRDEQKTGGLYNTQKVLKAPAKDNQGMDFWGNYWID